MTNTLPKIKTRSKKRVGRGYGSGKGGHTVGKGVKGQKSRKSLNILFEGVKVKKSFIKRLPLRRGRGRFRAKDKPIVVKLGYLNVLPAGSKVDIEALIKHGIVEKRSARALGVKILGDGELKKKLRVDVPTSFSAAKVIERLGGEVLTKLEEKKGKEKKVSSKSHD